MIWNYIDVCVGCAVVRLCDCAMNEHILNGDRAGRYTCKYSMRRNCGRRRPSGVGPAAAVLILMLMGLKRCECHREDRQGTPAACCQAAVAPTFHVGKRVWDLGAA